jgi:hypothetical protein
VAGSRPWRGWPQGVRRSARSRGPWLWKDRARHRGRAQARAGTAIRKRLHSLLAVPDPRRSAARYALSGMTPLGDARRAPSRLCRPRRIGRRGSGGHRTARYRVSGTGPDRCRGFRRVCPGRPNIKPRSAPSPAWLRRVDELGPDTQFMAGIHRTKIATRGRFGRDVASCVPPDRPCRTPEASGVRRLAGG